MHEATALRRAYPADAATPAIPHGHVTRMPPAGRAAVWTAVGLALAVLAVVTVAVAAVSGGSGGS